MIIQLNGMTETVPDGLTISGLIEWAKEGDPDLMVEKTEPISTRRSTTPARWTTMISLNLSTPTWADSLRFSMPGAVFSLSAEAGHD